MRSRNLLRLGDAEDLTRNNDKGETADAGIPARLPHLMMRNFRKLRNALAGGTLNVEQRELQYSASASW